MVFQTARLVYEDRPDLETKDVMTIAEAARALGVSVQAVAVFRPGGDDDCP